MAESRPLVSKASGIAEASWGICLARRTLLNQGRGYASVLDSKHVSDPNRFRSGDCG